MLPSGNPLTAGGNSGLYGPSGVAIGDIGGDWHAELVLSTSDCNVRAYTWQGSQLWAFDYCANASPVVDGATYGISSSEPVIADLNQDGKAEVVFTTFGPNAQPMNSVDSMNLWVLNGATGARVCS